MYLHKNQDRENFCFTLQKPRPDTTNSGLGGDTFEQYLWQGSLFAAQ
jgi:hypothetical protein